MKSSLALNFCLAVLVAAFGVAGCQKKPRGPIAIPSQTGARGTGDTFGREDVTALPVDDSTRFQQFTDPSGIALPIDPDTGMRRDEDFFRANTVYFDFDRSTIRAGERSKIEEVASHLKANAAHKAKVEGHCDERGTEGYNLALGERRALSVREYLVNLGISPDRIYTISFGESRPTDPALNEAAYARNRRGEFILLLP